MSLASEQRKEILQLLSEGKITSDEAAKMLGSPTPSGGEAPIDSAAIKSSESLVTSSGPAKDADGADGPSWFHVRVTDLNSGKGKVTVNIPLRLLKFGLAVGSRFAPELRELNWDELSSLVATEKGVLVDVLDEEDGEHVQVYLD